MDGVVEVRGGRIRGVQRHGQWSFSGIPYAASPAGGGRWRPPGPVAGLDGHQGVRPVRAHRPPVPGADRDVPRRRARRAGGGLPDPQYLDSGARRRPAAGDGLDPWGVVRFRVGGGGSVPRWHVVTRGRRRGSHHQLPSRAPRVPGPPGARGPGPDLARRPGVVGLGQLGPGRSGCRPLLGAGPHRRLRRRPGQRDPLRRVGRGHERVHPARHTRGATGSSTGPSCRAVRPYTYDRREGLGPDRAGGRPPGCTR